MKKNLLVLLFTCLTLTILSSSAMHSPSNQAYQEQRDLEQAIAASLHEAPCPARTEPEDADLQLARALSLSLQSQEAEARHPQEPQHDNDDLVRALKASAEQYELEKVQRQQYRAQATKELFRQLTLGTATPDSVKGLLQAGAYPNARDEDNYTPLMRAVRVFPWPIIRPIIGCLLKAGADINAQAEISPLILSLLDGKMNVAFCLIAQGADINFVEASCGYNMLWLALQLLNENDGGMITGRGFFQCLIMSRGINPNPAGRNPLQYAALGGHVKEAVSLLNLGAQVSVGLLCETARKGHDGVCRELLRHGAQVNEVSSEGFTPLMEAVGSGCRVTLDCILEHNPDCSLENELGHTAFSRASLLKRNLSQERYLRLALGGVPLTFANNECYALERAVSNGWQDVCQAIIEHAYLSPYGFEISDSRNRLHTGLLCLKRCFPQMPRDVKALIVQGPVLAGDYIMTVYNSLARGIAVSSYNMALLKGSIPQYTIELMRRRLQYVYVHAKTPGMQSLVDPATLEANYGHMLTALAHSRLDHMQEKALSDRSEKLG